jgi:predicted TPR repeat methyltransferase
MEPNAKPAAEESAAKIRQQFSAAIEHHRAGRLAEAERLYRALIASGHPIAEAHNNLGFLLHQRGDSAGALAEYRQAVAINPSDPGALNNLASTLRDLNDAEEAEACYRRALSIKPDHPEANNNLGMMLSDRGRHSEALEYYGKALAVVPAHAAALTNSGVALRRSGETDEAIALWRQTVSQRPDCVEAHVYLAETLADLGKLEEARWHALSADALKLPPRPAVHYALGIALARCNMRDAATARLRQCAAGDPHDRYGARLALSALEQGPMPERASPEFIVRLYAIGADRWDNPAGPNPYRGAELVAAKVGGSGLDILDAGCGTGLVGALVRDRSPIHFGDLGPAFAAAGAALRPGGTFIFTVFPNQRDDDVAVATLEGLGQGGCFLHGRGYVAATAQANGFEVEAIESEIHEYKNGSPMTGLVVVLRKA